MTLHIEWAKQYLQISEISPPSNGVSNKRMGTIIKAVDIPTSTIVIPTSTIIKCTAVLSMQ